MNELAGKLAELLDITKNAAMDLYPMIRDQYLWYGVADVFFDLSLVMLFVSLMISGVVTFFLMVEECWDIDDWKNNKKWVKWMYIIPVVSLAVMVASSITKYIVAPDIMIIMQFLN